MKKTKRYVIRNEDCRKTIKHMKQNGIKVDCVITSPPYNTSRKVRTEKKLQKENQSINYMMIANLLKNTNILLLQ